MAMHPVSPQLPTLIQEVVESLNYTFWGMQWLTQSQGQLLRVYIDAATGIDVEDCAKVSRQLSAVLDVENPLATLHTLEVSSPGMDRPIFTLAQYTAYCGSLLKLTLRPSVVGRKKYRGRLISVENAMLHVTVDGATIALAFDDIDTGRIIPEYST